MIRLNEAGETIVEVLMSIALLSLAITGSFVVARRSLEAGQASSERTQAVKIAETQIERLKHMATLPGNTAGEGVFQDGDFCLDVASGEVVKVISLPAAPPECSNNYFPASSLDVRITYSEAGPDGITSTSASLSPDDDLFTVSVNWDSATGRGRDRVIMTYRLHPIEL